MTETIGSNALGPTIAGRYADAYTTARRVASFGKILRRVGVVLVGIAVILSMLFALRAVIVEGDPDPLQLGVAMVAGLIWIATGTAVGIIVVLIGWMLAALGQVLMAILDTAVHSSPFLTDDERAQVMSFPCEQVSISRYSPRLSHEVRTQAGDSP